VIVIVIMVLAEDDDAAAPAGRVSKSQSVVIHAAAVPVCAAA
jgi:hypothetical protein